MSSYKTKPFSEEEKRRAILQYSEKISYSTRYSGESLLATRRLTADDAWEYRHVIVPRPMVRFVPPGVLMEETWRALGIKQSPGWEMYMRHDPVSHSWYRRPTELMVRSL